MTASEMRISLNGFRGMEGNVSLGRGLNIVLGPNNSGKTAILEALLHTMLLNLGDISQGLGFIQLSHDARGSFKHSLISLFPARKDTAEACVSENEKKHCVRLEKSEQQVTSQHSIYETIVNVVMKASSRDCRLIFLLGMSSGKMKSEGKECKGERVIAMITPGIIPYNYPDIHLGRLKAKNPSILEGIHLQVDRSTIKVDLAADPWGELITILVEDSGESESLSSLFYSVGRGVQRYIEIILLSILHKIILIDEIESSLHPELLAQLSLELAQFASKGKQIVATSQSLEATTMIASALLYGEPVGTPGELYRLLEKHGCPREKASLLNLLVTRRSGNKLTGMLVSGCDAAWEIAGSRDARLAYKILGH